MDTRTAKDLPVGSDVYARGLNWSKISDGTWESDAGDWFNDGQIDLLLGMGGTIMFVPVGRGREGSRS